MLLDAVLRFADVAARAAAAEEEVVLEHVAEPIRAGAYSEGDEADAEDEREEDEHPLRVVPQPREEELLLPRLRLLLTAAWSRRLRLLRTLLDGSSGHGRKVTRERYEDSTAGV